jgi:predicted ATPase/class 3 adenylate cyclase
VTGNSGTSRKLATIVALDVAGYSARTEADEAKTTAEIATLRKVIEAIAAKQGGRVFNTAGDGFMLEFGSSLSAVEAAIALAETCEPKVRIGVHLGDVVVQPNGDLLGHGVNVAARLMAKSDPGSALISADVRRTVRGPLAERLHSRGVLKLDKMSETIEAFATSAAQPTQQPLTAPSVVYRATMELSEIACLAAGVEPRLNITSGLELQFFRILRDAANDGRLEMVSTEGRDKFGEHSQTSADKLLEFMARHPNYPVQILSLSRNWIANPQPRHYSLKLQPGVFKLTGQDVSLVHGVTTAVPAAADVFLSYAREDQAVARKFAEALEREGLGVWWDIALRSGDTYDEAMEAALRGAKAVVVLWSKSSVNSRWVRSEATLADRNKTFVPAMIEACERPIMFELTQTAELSHWHGAADDPNWLAFVADVRVKLGGEGKPVDAGRVEHTKTTLRSNLAPGRAELFGRASDIEMLRAALAAHRLLTIAGPGGVGKSSVAHAVAAAVKADFPDGVWWVELAPVADGALVVDAIARSAGLSLREGLPDLVEQIKDRRMLLILDNCEHVIAGAAEASEAIVHGTEHVCVLTTSQERLRCAHEHMYRLQPLATPEGSADRKGSDALDLFAARARAVSPGFALGPANIEAVAQICRQLDGLPLAIELAAARLPLLGLDGLRQRLEDRFRVLGNASRTAPNRQRTLRGALEWSHSLLTATEQTLFARLGVFAGWFDLDALEQVCADASIESWEVIDLANSLLDKSLLTLDPQDPPRYRLLETPRAFAAEQLAKSQDARAIHARHAGLMRSRLLQAQEAQWTPNASTAIDKVVQDIANLRAALHWAASKDGDSELLIALAGTGSVVWTQAGAEAEALNWCETALRAVTEDTQPLLEAELLVAFVKLTHQSDAAREVAALERASALFASQFERKGQYIALGALAKKHAWRRDVENAERAIEAAQAIFEPSWPAAIQANLLQAKTYLLEMLGRAQEGERYMIELLEIMRALGDPEQIDLAMIELAESYMVQGKLEEAAALRQRVHDRPGRKTPDTFNLANLCATYTQMDRLDEALNCARECTSWLMRSKKVHVFLEHFGLLSCKRGRLIEGAHLIGLSDAHYRTSGFEREMSEARSRAQADALLRAAFDEARLQELYAEGCRMSVSDAVDAGLAA